MTHIITIGEPIGLNLQNVCDTSTNHDYRNTNKTFGHI